MKSVRGQEVFGAAPVEIGMKHFEEFTNRHPRHRYWSRGIGNASYPTTRPCLGLSVNSYRLRSHTDTLETKRLQAFHAFWSSWALCAADRLVAVLCFTAVSI